MQIQIDIKDLLYPTLERISGENGLTPELYARNIVTSFLERQYRAEFKDTIKESTVEEIEDIKDKLKSKPE